MCKRRRYHGLPLGFRFRNGFQIVLFGNRDHSCDRSYKCVQPNTPDFPYQSSPTYPRTTQGFRCSIVWFSALRAATTVSPTAPAKCRQRNS